jgi:hypothetical protein
MPRLGLELTEQCLKQLLPFALRAEVELRGGTRQRQQLAQQRDIVFIPHTRCEQCPQFTKLGLDRIVADKPGGAFELPNKGMERAVLVVRRAEITKARMVLGFNVLGKCCCEPRLADAWLSRNQHHSPFARFRLLPAADKQLDFLITTDERRRTRAQCLEPTQNAALANDPPCRLQLGKAGKCSLAEIGQIEQPSDLAARRFIDYQTVRRSECLQPRREVGCPADNRLFLRRALADQIADDHQPRRDPDPRLEFNGSDIEAADRADRSQSRPDSPLGVVLMRSRVAEIDRDTVAHVFGDKAVEAADHVGDGLVIGGDDLAQILGVETRSERCRADEIAKHHRQLPPLGVALRRERHGRFGWRPWYVGRGRGGAQSGDGIEQATAVADRGDAQLAQILGGQPPQDRIVDVIVAESRSVLFEPQSA